MSSRAQKKLLVQWYLCSVTLHHCSLLSPWHSHRYKYSFWEPASVEKYMYLLYAVPLWCCNFGSWQFIINAPNNLAENEGRQHIWWTWPNGLVPLFTSTCMGLICGEWPMRIWKMEIWYVHSFHIMFYPCICRYFNAKYTTQFKHCSHTCTCRQMQRYICNLYSWDLCVDKTFFTGHQIWEFSTSNLGVHVWYIRTHML